MKVVKEELSKILARANITESTQWLSVKKRKKGCFYTFLGPAQKTFVIGCTYSRKGPLILIYGWDLN